MNKQDDALDQHRGPRDQGILAGDAHAVAGRQIEELLQQLRRLDVGERRLVVEVLVEERGAGVTQAVQRDPLVGDAHSVEQPGDRVAVGPR